MLEIKNLHASIEEDGTEILHGIDLTIKPGEVHAIMGLNGSGKSTLANVLSGREGYEVGTGAISFEGEDLLEIEDCIPRVWERARRAQEKQDKDCMKNV